MLRVGHGPNYKTSGSRGEPPDNVARMPSPRVGGRTPLKLPHSAGRGFPGERSPSGWVLGLPRSIVRLYPVPKFGKAILGFVVSVGPCAVM
jgi:hypothetical protein